MTSVLQKEPEFKPQELVKAREFDMTFLNEQEEKGKRNISEMARLSTPKPIMHLGSSTEFQRPSPETSSVPRTRHSRIGNSSGLGLFKPSTGLNSRHRPMTGAEPPINRPMTAVRGAGYTSSHGGRRTLFDPLHEGAQSSNISELELQKDDTPEERIRQQEAKIMQLIEEACAAQAAGENKVALTKAKEASNKERSLIRMQEQSGMGDHHNIDLTYAVLFTLANQYAANELYTEALNTYQMITKNRMFSNAYRLKVNMGNIYFKQGQYQKAVKMFRMALDQVPSSQKCLRIKIMHNIAMVFIQTGQLEEALGGLEYIMSEAPSHRAGLHLVACCRATEDRERMRAAFALLLGVPLDVEDEEKYHLEQDSPEDALIATAIQNDDLHKYEMKRRQDAEYCILTAAKLIAPFVEDNFSAGYDWCVNAIKNSEYARLAANLEINKAVMHLKEDQLNEAIQALKAYEKDSNIVVSAAVNLSFIYYLQGDYDNALKYAEIVKKVDVKDANAYVNYGSCLLEKGQLEEAVSAFEKALECDPTHFEAIYNSGIAFKRAGHYDEAMDCYQRFSGSLALLPEVAYQTADTLALLGDGDAAVDAFHRLLGLTPSDAAALKKLGELCDRLGDRRQAHHWYSESFRFYAADLSVIDWLGSYYIEMQVVEKALVYFEKAAIMQPNEPRWTMMSAACHRRSGNMHKALTLYQEIHKQFPENIECLKFLVRLCSDLGMREAQDYIAELKRLEKANEIRERVGSSRPGSRKSNSGLSSRVGSGFSPVHENVAMMASPRNSANRNLRSSRLIQSHNSASSSESLYGQQPADTSYSDPLGPQPSRPRTGAGRPLDFDDFANEELGDDLLPE